MSCLPCILVLLSVTADREASVAAGREALDRWVGPYPWYDSRTDGVRPIDVSEPDARKEPRRNWLRNLFRSGGAHAWLQWLAWTVIAVLLIVLAYVLVRAYLLPRRGKSGSVAGATRDEAADAHRRTEALPSAARKRGDLLDEARQSYQQGDYSQAIVYLFSYQLVELDKHQWVRLAKGKTNRQYLREIGGRMTLRGLVERTMVAFEDAFFGNYAIDRARFESIWSRLGEFETLVAVGSRQ